jgi:hypothetical protein
MKYASGLCLGIFVSALAAGLWFHFSEAVAGLEVPLVIGFFGFLFFAVHAESA